MLHPNTIIIYNITATTINIQALKNVPGSKLQLHHNTGLTGLDLLPTILTIDHLVTRLNFSWDYQQNLKILWFIS